MPECAFNLAHAAIYLALAPKSDTVKRALKATGEWIDENGAPEPPGYLKSAAYPGAKALGRGEGYDYPHARAEGVSPQELMPPEAAGERFVELTDHGEEKSLRERLQRIRQARGR
jgi:putative ATPase